MPYLAHFGLKDHPFTLTPNVDYYYPTQENANIIASLDFALRRDSGIIKIVGEVGTGKTLLCRLLINKLVDTDSVAYINAPQADAGSIVRAICDEFGIEQPGADGSPYAALNRFLVDEHAKGRLAVVVVDEAQHLGKDGLEAIRLVSNLETERSKLLQIVLFGQTELDDLLRDPSLRQLNQRVVFSFNTKPLTLAEAKRYIGHRIRVSRRQGVEYEVFSDAALTAIAKASGGIPRVINILSDKSLLVAFSDGSPTVQRSHAAEAIKDTPGLVVRGGLRWGLPGVGWKTAAAAAALAVTLGVVTVGAVAGWNLWRSNHRPHGVAAVEAPATAPAGSVAPPLPATVTAPPAPLPPAQVRADGVAPTSAPPAPPPPAATAVPAAPAASAAAAMPTPASAPPPAAAGAPAEAPPTAAAPVAAVAPPAPTGGDESLPVAAPPPAVAPQPAEPTAKRKTSARPTARKVAEHGMPPTRPASASPSPSPSASDSGLEAVASTGSPSVDAAPAATAPARPAAQPQAAAQPLAPTQTLTPPPPESAPVEPVTAAPFHPGIYPGAKGH